jgi:hypothetical protein
MKKVNKVRVCHCGCGKKFICNYDNCNAPILRDNSINRCYYFDCLEDITSKASWKDCNQKLYKGKETFIFR